MATASNSAGSTSGAAAPASATPGAANTPAEVQPVKKIAEKPPQIKVEETVGAPAVDTAVLSSVKPRDKARKAPIPAEEQRERQDGNNSVEKPAPGEQVSAVVPQIDSQIRADLTRLSTLRAKQNEQARQVIEATATKDAFPEQRSETKERNTSNTATVASATVAVADLAFKERVDQQRAQEARLPPEVRDGYVQVGDRFYERGNTSRVAFVDKGVALKTASNDPETAKVIVALADARGWTSIKVKGSDVFRREAYVEGASRGVRVEGYVPLKQDLAEIEVRAQRFLNRNAVVKAEAQEFRDVMAQGAVTARPELASAALAARQAETYAANVKDPEVRQMLTRGFQEQIAKGIENGQRPRALDDPALRARVRVPEGEYIEAKSARYNFDRNEQQSFYVKYRDSESGDVRIKWGKGLQDALIESKAQPGDVIRLQREGSRAVTVAANVRDQNDAVVGQQTIIAKRSDWKVEVLERKAQRTIQPPERMANRGR